MKRYELTGLLRVGPWWVGVLMLLPLLLPMTAGLFVRAYDAFVEGAKENAADLRTALAAIWADRK